MKKKPLRILKLMGMAIGLVLLVAAGLLVARTDRTTLRQFIDLVGRRDKSKPPIYHEYEGYSPGLRKSRVTEEFSRYHYYIAPDEAEAADASSNAGPDIYFRQDFEEIVRQATFDEEQYWREHPLDLGDETVVVDN